MTNTYCQRFLTTEERFWQKVQKAHSENGCWLWQNYLDKDGYGHFWIGSRIDKSRRPIRAHRFAYELLVEPIPPNMTIDHICRHRNCVNPNHLRILSKGENMLAGNNIQAQNKRKTHCKRGHPLKGRFLQIVYRGDRIERHCRECKRLWMAEYRTSKRLNSS